MLPINRENGEKSANRICSKDYLHWFSLVRVKQRSKVSSAWLAFQVVPYLSETFLEYFKKQEKLEKVPQDLHFGNGLEVSHEPLNPIQVTGVRLKCRRRRFDLNSRQAIDFYLGFPNSYT